MSRPQSVLGDDTEMYVHTPRDQELKPVKSGKTRGGYHELRGIRDSNAWVLVKLPHLPQHAHSIQLLVNLYFHKKETYQKHVSKIMWKKLLK